MILLTLFTAVLLTAQLRLNTSDLAHLPDGLSVFTMNDLAFQGALGQFFHTPDAPDLAPILPVVVMIRNNSRQKIGYLNIRYTYTVPDGDHAVDITYSRNPLMGDQFEPGQEILMYPGMGAVGHHVTGANPKMIEQTRVLLAKCQAVNISIDAVTWEDGRIDGPDHAGIAQRYQSQREAVEAVYTEAMGRSHVHRSDEAFTRTYERVTGFAHGDPAVMKQMLDKFAPLKRSLQ